MRIGAVSFQPYIYNTNYVNRNSLGRVAAISDDLQSEKTDYSDLTQETNSNPLGRGETAGFADILQMQFQMGRMNADRLIKPAEGTQQEPLQEENNLYMRQKAAEAYSMNMIA